VVAPVTDRLPLIVGIAAHRRLHERGPAILAALERRLRSILARLKQDYLEIDPRTQARQTPVIVISNLVGKAHRVAENAAWGSGAGIVSPFGAMSPDVAESLLKPDPQRDRAACMFVARYSHVLIAIWDGDESDGEDGAPAQIVRFRRKGIPLPDAHTARACIDAAEIGPLIEVRVPGEGGSPDDIEVLPWGLEFVARHEETRWQGLGRGLANFGRHLAGYSGEPAPVGASDEERQMIESWTNFAALTGLTREFNADAAGLSSTSDGAAKLTQSLEWLFSIEAGAARGRAALAGAMQAIPRWCRLYAIADTLAQQWQKHFWKDWKWLFALALAAIACFELFAHLGIWLSEWFLAAMGLVGKPASGAPAPGTMEIVLLGGYMTLLVSGYGIYLAANHYGHQERFLDYRALAEALRVATFWQFMGVGEEPGRAVGSVADAYPIKQPSELAWVKTCLLTLELLDHAEHPAARRPLDEPTAYCWLRDLWVEGQGSYFSRSARRYDELAAIHEDRSFAMLIASILVALALIFLARAEHLIHHTWPYDAMIFIIGVLPGVAAAFIGFSEKLAYKAQARQYDRMRGVFAQALAHLPEKLPSADCSRFKELFYQLGMEAMREHAEWVAIYRQRPIQPP
jgi:hypothetical protein